MKLSHSDIDFIIQIVDDAIWNNMKPYATEQDVLFLSDLVEDEIKDRLRDNISED